MNTEWRPTPDGYYEVSSDGLVRRVSTGKIRKPYETPFGYLSVSLSIRGQCVTKHVHVLVLEAFRGPRPEHLDCNHRDGNKTNNAIDNLEWVSRSYNLIHRSRTLGLARGEGHGHAKATEAIVRHIRSTPHESTRSLARQFGLSQSAVCKILHRETWIHV